jgi:hypothetical protein
VSLTPVVLTDAYITINSNVVSDHGTKVEIPVKVNALNATTFGQTWEVKTGGLKSASLNIEFLQDFSAANLDAIFWPLIGTVVPFEIRPTSGARSATNPAYTGTVLIDSWDPINGKVGDLDAVSVSFPTSGAVTRATS